MGVLLFLKRSEKISEMSFVLGNEMESVILRSRNRT